jgi:hypothetical protein
MSSPLAVRVHIPLLEEMNDLRRDNCQLWRHYTSSSSVHRDVAYGSFARRCGRLMEITGVDNAKDIQALSMVPSEGELDHSRPHGPRDSRGCTGRRIVKSAEAYSVAPLMRNQHIARY